MFAMMSAALAMGTQPPAAAAVEHLGRPCRAKNVLAGRIVTDRQTGRERFVITNMNETTGAELIFIDFEHDTGKVFHAPKGSGAWALLEAPGDRLIVGTFYDGQFMVFDLKKMAFVKSAGFPGETYIWNLAMGGDGRVYGGSYGHGKLGALDLKTYAVEDLGAPAPPNLYLRYVSTLPDGRILCHFYTEKPTTLIFDPATKQFTPAPSTLAEAQRGVTWNGYFLTGNRVYHGRELALVEPPPFPTPTGKGAWSVNLNLTTPDTLYLAQGSTLYRYRAGEAALTRVARVDLRGGAVYAVSRTGALLGVRGQDYAVIRPGASKVTLRPIPVESGPRPTLFLKAGPDGLLWGGPDFGQTLFSLDPRTKKAVNTGKICAGGGEVYDVTFKDGAVYAVAYAGGDIVRYEPRQPWDQWDGKNPRTIAHFEGRGYIRPVGGVVVGPDGLLYSGWMAKYGTYGGALAVTDPTTGKSELTENPLGQQAVSGVAVDDACVYLGTSLAANGLPDKKGEPTHFGVLDRATKKVLVSQPFEGAASLHSFALDRAAGRLAFAAGQRICLFSTADRRFVDLPAGTPPLTGNGVCAPGDGRLYFGSGASLVALNLRTGAATTLATLPAAITNTTVGPDGAVYVSCGPDVYRVR